MKKVLFPYILRFGFCLFWLTIFIGFLYLPYLTFFRTSRSINIVCWADLFDPNYLAKFEKETGIKVNLSYFDNNEELLVKLRTTGGKGFDLLVLSDYIISELREADFIQKIDSSKISFLDRIDPFYKQPYYDPTLEYTLPYSTSIYGLGVNKSFFDKGYERSWSLIFNPKKEYTVGMLDNPREVFSVGAQYAFQTKENLSLAQIKDIEQLLIKQKDIVSAYSEFRADYLLLTGTSPVTIISSPWARRLLKAETGFDFFVPREGGFLLVDSFVIPKYSEDADAVYQFLNYIYKPESLKYHFDSTQFLPATLELEKFLQADPESAPIYRAHFLERDRLYFFNISISLPLLSSLWINIKAS